MEFGNEIVIFCGDRNGARILLSVDDHEDEDLMGLVMSLTMSMKVMTMRMKMMKMIM